MTAAQWLRECLEIHRNIGDPVQAITGIELAAAIAHQAGDASLAVTLIASASKLRAASGYAIYPSNLTLEDLARSLEPAVFQAARLRGEDAAFPEIVKLIQLFDPRHVRTVNPSQHETPKPTNDAADHGLTIRELDVLRLVAEGKTNAEIGHALFISPFTAKTHVANLLGKLNVDSRAAAATWAVRNGIL